METMCGTPYAVVAKRGSGSISFVSCKESNDNFDLPVPTAPNSGRPGPMYVSYSNDRIYVEDRANNAVAVINPEDLEEAAVITDVRQGIFHQWSNDKNFVIACDISNTVAIVNLKDNTIKGTINLMDQGGRSISAMQKPHDIVITPSGDAISVSILATVAAATDAIIKIDTVANTVVRRIDLPSGTDPHLGLSSSSPDLLYSPQQNIGIVAVYSQDDLTEVQPLLAVPNAHGIGASSDRKYLCVTNISGGGTGGLVTIQTGTNATVVETIDTPEAVPQNVAADDDGCVYVTHSGGAADQLSVYSTNASGIPTLFDQYTVGANPFGLAVVEYKCIEDPSTNLAHQPPNYQFQGLQKRKKFKENLSYVVFCVYCVHLAAALK
ncbi:hypothetical protein ACHAWO_004049 [Cyclotella atomus]|uniref:YncE family protein n=1 Tax=Cyclotella atomus TaxID=382360 RepID=A0ABD3MYK2_9STRA